MKFCSQKKIKVKIKIEVRKEKLIDFLRNLERCINEEIFLTHQILADFMSFFSTGISLKFLQKNLF